ncbi:hypothetical protein M1N56_04000 [Dehalococcoidia bacterium]|nr:hypothetical protein [Dehalococcoidia bacterium]
MANMMSELTLIDLVSNGTMDAEIAATLSSVTSQQHSFVVVAVPRFAGKSTVIDAMLHCVPTNVPVHRLSGDEAEMDRLKLKRSSGYLVIGEFSKGPVPGYIWGSPVRKVFETMRVGYSLSTALHAPSMEEAYAAICQANGVPDEDASNLTYMVYIERMGDAEDSFWRRISQVQEVERVVGGRPQGRLLFRWSEKNDSFEQVEEPRLLGINRSRLRERACRITELVTSGRASVEDVRSMIARL